MARKTNKTNHVLGLLAGKNEEVADTGAAAEEKNETSGEVKDSPASAASNVQVVAKQEEDDMIADTVKQLLEEELDAEEAELSEPAKAPEADAEETGNDVQDDAGEPAVQETVEGEAEEMQKIDVDMQLSKEDQKELERLENEGNAAATEDDYVFLNVMENLVNETVDKWMQQFGTCTCSRCRADVVALSLTNLPAKYVVVGRNAAAPLMNFYSQQFSGAITVEVTKACTKVMERPHHNRD